MTTSQDGSDAWRQRIKSWGTIVCISTADYASPIWTNKQHIMCRLAAETSVVYVDSLGLRRPRFAPADVRRMIRRLPSPVMSPPNTEVAAPAQLSLLSPLVIPLHGVRLARKINRSLLTASVGSALEGSSGPRLLWTYNPLVVDELPLREYDGVVYHCVDDLASMPRVPSRAVRDAEQRLLPQADAVFASSVALAERLSRISPDRVHLVNNVADAEHFSTAQSGGELPADLRRIPEPRALFIGSLSDYKIDWQLLSNLAARRQDWSFVFIGPYGQEETNRALTDVRQQGNVHFLGYRDYNALPRYLGGAQVGLIPYRVTPHTTSVFPLKTWEYLAAGLHVISTELPALRAVDPPVTFAPTAASFASALDAPGPLSPSERLAIASRWTWDALLDRMTSLIPSPTAGEIQSLHATHHSSA